MFWFLPLFLTAPAHGTDGPAWRWEDDSSHRWVIQAHIQSPYVVWMLAERNHEVRVAQVLVGAVVSCWRHAPLKHGVDVICDVEDASVLATPLVSDRDRALSILREYEGVLEQAEIRFRSTPEGRVRDVRLRGVDITGDRSKFVAESARRLVEKALSPLDIPLPPRALEGTEWAYREPLGGKLLVSSKLLGSFEFVERVGAVEADAWRSDGVGEGTVSVGDDFWSLDYRGQAWFDEKLGGYRSSKLVVTGTPSPGSRIASFGDPVPYVLRASVEALGPTEPQALRPSGEL